MRNLSDGRVEVIFEGEEDMVRILVDFARHGPHGARVRKVELTWEPYTGKYRGFTIEY